MGLKDVAGRPNKFTNYLYDGKESSEASWIDSIEQKDVLSSSNRNSSRIIHTLYKIKTIHKIVTQQEEVESRMSEMTHRQLLEDNKFVRGYSLCRRLKTRRRKVERGNKIISPLLEANCKKSCKKCVEDGGEYHSVLYNVPVYVRYGGRDERMYKADTQLVAVDCVCIP